MTADSGPTTAGSIVGKLRMDRSQWVSMMAATKSDIRDLENSDPDIHIDTNAAQVAAKLATAKAAADALGTSTEELGRKTKRTTDETIKANEANKTSVTRVGAIVTAVALLVPLLAPVGAAVVGLGGAFLGMGAAGIFALIGIKREMEDGTAVGGAYRDGLDDLGGSMDKLSRTAAVSMLSSFRQVVRETREALPGLNTQVGQMSTILGRSGGAAFTGAINALRILNPLFLTAGLYVQSLAEGFRDWTEGSGIEAFNGYALSALPQVTEVLGKLASMVMHILQALAPLGTIGLIALGGIADLINAIPVEILSQLIVTITWGAIAFKAWGFIAPMLASIATSMGAVGVATTIATGPIGWVVAGLSALAGIFAVIIASNQQAANATAVYTAALEADNGALARNVRLKAAQVLAEKDAFKMAGQLGIAKQDLVGYILGEGDAIDRVNAKLGIFGKALGDQTIKRIDESGLSMQGFLDTTEDLQGVLDEQSGVLKQDAQDWRDVTEATTTATVATRAQQAADEAVAAGLGISVGALQGARGSQDDLTGATEKATAQMYIQGDAAGMLKQKLDQLNGKAISAAEAQNQFEAQLIRLPNGIDTVTGKFDESALALDGMSEAAITNRGSLLDLIQSSQAAATAYRDQGASSDEAKQKMIDGRTAIIEQAVANGMNRDAVTAYVDSLYKIPETVPKTKVEVDTAAAEATLTALARTRDVVLNVITSYPNGKPLSGQQVANQYGIGGGANGMTAPGMAGGGSVVGPGNAGSDTAGFYRLAHGEEVVSNMFGQADRNRTLLKQINAGFTPTTPMAGTSRGSGAAVGAAIDQKRPVVNNVYVNTVQNEDPRILGNIVGRGVKDALRGAGVVI